MPSSRVQAVQPRGFARVLVSSLLLGVVASADAQLVDVSPFAIVEAIYDDNVFRVENAEQLRAQSPDGEVRQGDAIGIATVGVTGELEPGLQAFNLTSLVQRYQYHALEQLNHTAYEIDGRWNWVWGRRFDGLVQASMKRAQDDFRYRDSAEQSFTLERRYELAGAYHLSSLWHLEIGSVFTSRSSSDLGNAASDLDEHSFDLAGFYRRNPVGQLGLALTYRDGEYPNRDPNPGTGVATSYEQYTGEVRMRWVPSAISRLDGAIGVTRREQSPFSDRDFSGVTGRLDYRREISGRTRVSLNAFRRVWSTERVDANFATDSGLGATLEWRWSVKTQFLLDGEWRTIHYESVAGAGAGAPEQEDEIRSGQLTMVWQPLERLGVRLSGERELRDSNVAGDAYAAWISRLEVRLGF